jgi:hypothetical protein
MPTVFVGDVIQARLTGKLFGQTMINVLHYQITTVTTSADYQDTLTELVTLWPISAFQTAFLSNCPSDYTLQTVQFQRVAATREVFRSLSVNTVGTGAAADPAGFANGTITKQTGAVSHHARGSTTRIGGTGVFHIPGLPSGAAANGLLTGGYMTSMAALATQMLVPLSGMGTGVYTPCIWHRKKTPQPSSDVLISAYVQPTVRSLKRRVVGHGI